MTGENQMYNYLKYKKGTKKLYVPRVKIISLQYTSKYSIVVITNEF
jgi:hypothetical protein